MLFGLKGDKKNVRLKKRGFFKNFGFKLFLLQMVII